jgi:hypothetical protein
LCEEQILQHSGPKIIFQFAEFAENTPPPPYTNICISGFKR